jgi:hypothetical protein
MTLAGVKSLSYNITGGGAPISRQSKKCRQKHGGFSRLLTPSGNRWEICLRMRYILRGLRERDLGE